MLARVYRAISSFAFFKAFSSLYLAIAFFHAWETEAGRCLLMEGCDLRLHWLRDSQLHLWECAWACATAVALLLPALAGWQRQLLSAVLLVGWVGHISYVAFTPPHMPYVTLALVYLCGAHGSCDDKSKKRSYVRATLMFQFLRSALAVGYGFSAIAKLGTPAWRGGWVFEMVAINDVRPWVLGPLAAALSAFSVPMTAASLFIEGGMPVAEAIACCMPRPADTYLSMHVMWALSGLLQVGILTLLPITDVSAGCLLFHAALQHAAAHVAHVRAVDGAQPIWRNRWPRLSAAAFVTGLLVTFSWSSVECHLRPSKPRVELALTLHDKFVKAFMPMGKTSWDSWPCASSNMFGGLARGAEQEQGLLVALAMGALALALLRLHVRARGSLLAAALVAMLATCPLRLADLMPSPRSADDRSDEIGMHVGASNGSVLAIRMDDMAG